MGKRVMENLKCPYCEHKFNHDGDFECLDNNNRLAVTCPNDLCEKQFACYVDFQPTYSDGYKIDCWNEIKCNMVLEKRNSYPDMQGYRCEYCRRLEFKKTNNAKA